MAKTNQRVGKSSTGVSFRSDIEGLRAVAVGLVFANHLYGWPSGGFIGVDVFFVISGYLITKLLVRECGETGRISFTKFYARRIKRIVPVAVLVLVTTDLLAKYQFTAVRASQTIRDSLWAAVFGANFHFASQGTNYFDHNLPPSPLQHFWSLSVEEQFYVVWPVLIIVGFGIGRLVRRRRIGLQSVLLLAVLASLIWSITSTPKNVTAAYFSTPVRAWELGLGALLAVNQARVSQLPERLLACLGWIGFVGVIGASFVINSTSVFPGAIALLPVVSAVFLLATGDAAGSPGVLVIANPVFRYIGKISYSLYLWHFPMIIFAESIWSSSSAQVRLGVPILALTLSVASYTFVEDPIRKSSWLTPAVNRKRRRVGDPRFSFTSHQGNVGLACLALFALLLTAGLMSQQGPAQLSAAQLAAQQLTTAQNDQYVLGAPGYGVAKANVSDTASISPEGKLERAIATAVAQSDLPADIQPPLSTLTQDGAPEWVADKCLDVTTPQIAARCVYGAAKPTKSVALLGDSIAASWLPGLRLALTPLGVAIHVLTVGACPVGLFPIYTETSATTPDARCAAHHPFVLNQLKVLRPDLVIISDQGYAAERMIGEVPDSAGAYATWKSGLTEALRQLLPYTRHVVLLRQPSNSKNLQTCSASSQAGTECLATVSPEYTAISDAEKAATVSVGGTFITTLPWFCFDNTCPAVIGTTPVMWDGSHITAAYSASLAPLLKASLAPLLVK